MHVNYYCDTCGKAYPNEKEAIDCEKKHTEEARAAKEKEEERLLAKKAIDEASEKLSTLKAEYDLKYGAVEDKANCSFELDDLFDAILNFDAILKLIHE